MIKDKALRLALEALENLAHYADTCELFLKETHPGKADALRNRVTNSIEAITAIKAALEAKDEPVAWMNGWGDLFKNPDDAERGQTMQPLYTTPPQRTWVGLTAQEAADCWTTNATKTWNNFEAKLKSKNT
jgi:hypothetical protein